VCAADCFAAVEVKEEHAGHHETRPPESLDPATFDTLEEDLGGNPAFVASQRPPRAKECQLILPVPALAPPRV
jgi:hypothetical protein